MSICVGLQSVLGILRAVQSSSVYVVRAMDFKTMLFCFFPPQIIPSSGRESPSFGTRLLLQHTPSRQGCQGEDIEEEGEQ